MGVYAVTLAAGNYIAPIVCGFMAINQGWKWPFYWASIFNAAAFIICFFLLEETNYIRPTVGVVTGEDSKVTAMSTEEKDIEGITNVREHTSSLDNGIAPTRASHSRKTYVQRMFTLHPMSGRGIFSRAFSSLQYATWPIILYCGFSYGSYLVSFRPSNAHCQRFGLLADTILPL